MAHNKTAPLTVEEMNALANRFEARAGSVLLRDQPQMQSDMRLAATLIHELITNSISDRRAEHAGV